MLKSNYKNNLIINSLVDLGDDIAVEGKGKGRKFVSRFIEPGVAHYEDFGDVLITKETLDKFIQTMVGCPVIIKHKDIDDKNVDKERVGVVSEVWYNEADGWFYCKGIIWDKQAIDLVKNQGWNVSCTYDFDSDKQSKTHNGKKIDMEFTGGEFLHLALVPNPRYERANIVMNSKVENEDKWITIKPNGEDGKGRHLKLEDGETPKEAMKRQWGVDVEKKSEISDLLEEHKKWKERSTEAEKKYEKNPDNEFLEDRFKMAENKNIQALKNLIKEIQKQTGNIISEEQLKKIIFTQPDKLSEFLEKKQSHSQDKGEGKKYTWDNKEYTADELMEQGFHPMKYSGSIYKDDHLTYLEKNDGKKLYRVKISEDEYKELKQKKDEKNKPVGLSDVSSLLSDENKFKKIADDLYYNEPHRANVSGELRQKLYHTIHTNLPLTKSEWNERLRRQLKKINKSNNSLDSIITNALTEVIIENCLGE